MNNEYRNTGVQAEEDGVSVGELFSSALKGMRRYLSVLLIMLLVLGAALLFRANRTYVPRYSSTADFVINISGDFGDSNRLYDNKTAQLLSKTFPYIIDSGILDNMVRNDVGAAIDKSQIEGKSEGETNLFSLKVTSDTPENAYDVLQSVIDNYPTVAEYVVGDTTFTLIDESGVVESPVNSPAYRTALIIAGSVSLGVYILLVLFWALSHKTVRSSDDIKKVLNARNLTTVPMVSFKKSRKNPEQPVLITNSKISSGFRESMVLLRTRILRENSGKVIIVTSAAPGEGKTTVSANLAIALAQQGKRVVLIDCDLRNPSVLSTFGIKKKVNGLGDYLEGKVPLSSIGFKLPEHSNLAVIPGGGKCDNPAEVIGQDKMRRLISQLREGCDYIIMDSAPCGVMSDAASLAACADSALFVIRQDYADVDRITDGVDLLLSSGVSLLGTVINKATRSGGGYYGYGYGGYYGRYRYYGYGSYGGYSHYSDK